jgi:DNA-binding LacI/PurR family transcriptional regulator
MDPLKPSPREIIDRQLKQCLETGDRQELANILDDEVVTKRLEAARYSEAIARKALDVLLARRVDGIILQAPQATHKMNDDYLRDLAEEIPLIMGQRSMFAA